MFDFQCSIFDSAICILLSCMLNLYWLKITKLVNNLGRNFTKKSQSPNMWWACYLSCIPDPFLKFFIIYFREAQIIVGRKCTTIYLKLACILLKVPWHLRLHMILKISHQSTFYFWGMRTWHMWKVYLQTFRSKRMLAYFFRNLQTSRTNNSRILRITNAKFSGYCFYMNTNIYRDFQICIWVPLNKEVCNTRPSTRGREPSLNFFSTFRSFCSFFATFFQRCTKFSDLDFDFQSALLKLQQLLYFQPRTQALYRSSETIDDMKLDSSSDTDSSSENTYSSPEENYNDAMFYLWQIV